MQWSEEALMIVPAVSPFSDSRRVWYRDSSTKSSRSHVFNLSQRWWDVVIHIARFFRFRSKEIQLWSAPNGSPHHRHRMLITHVFMSLVAYVVFHPSTPFSWRIRGSALILGILGSQKTLVCFWGSTYHRLPYVGTGQPSTDVDVDLAATGCLDDVANRLWFCWGKKTPGKDGWR